MINTIDTCTAVKHANDNDAQAPERGGVRSKEPIILFGGLI